ncbi:hypothetical protein FZZ93_05600 [Halomonas eurihalina]|uniref:Uncharacterized protein n=1 Tax=Halomonas eurihalina TaxID=42566 RepID=A0A5D9DBB7_HALER|nr:hypothetical protein [Halomonas eurihalina]MDR5859443.1 hypothetical protein [Halomonas eurihalina]TZG40522.1 hypothetical protein FZZ93_05600 [Halomonas eurihalina]
MNVITEVKPVSLQEFDAMNLDGFNIINAAQDDGPVAEGDDVYRTIDLWTDRSAAEMVSLGHFGKGESIRVLQINVPDIADEEAIERLRQKVSARMA